MSSTDRQYFRTMYATNPDPWNFESSPYERRKYRLTLDTLVNERYCNAFEPGGSIGVLSELLATRCERLLVTDIVGSVVEQATLRLQRFEHVVVEQRGIPESWPDEIFDLVVLSEIAYYFDPPTLREVLLHIERTTEPGAHVVATHWRGLTDYPLSGDGAHEIINANANLRRRVHHVESEFVIDLWERIG